MKVLIIGGGIAGPALAYWLGKQNQDNSRDGTNLDDPHRREQEPQQRYDITVLERSPDLRASGQQIDLRGQGIVLMKMMGLEAELRAVRCADEAGLRVRDRREGGRSVAFFPATAEGAASQGAVSEWEIMRGDLVRVLHGATRGLPGVRYVFGLTADEILQPPQQRRGDGGQEGPGPARVRFSDGSEAEYDLVVGADGAGSRTRRTAMPDIPDPRHDVDVHVSLWSSPAEPGDPTDWTVCWLPGGGQLSTRKDSPDSIRVYWSTQGRSGCEALHAAGSLAEKKAALAEELARAEAMPGAGDSWGAARFRRDLLASPLADDLYCQHLHQIRLPPGAWSRDRVVLLGDAAHCPTPLGGGYGTTSALIGAYILAGELSKQMGTGRASEEKGRSVAGQQGLQVELIETAAAAYERTLRPLITEKQESVKPWIIRAVYPKTQLGISTLQTVIQLISKLAFLSKIWSWQKPEESARLEYEDYFGVAPKVPK